MIDKPLNTYQDDASEWINECFDREIVESKLERNFRFFEEAVELVQACDFTAEQAHDMVDYVFNRPKGEINQELGGVMVALLCLADVHRLKASDCLDAELNRCWLYINKIKEKQKEKTLAVKPGLSGGEGSSSKIIIN